MAKHKLDRLRGALHMAHSEVQTAMAILPSPEWGDDITPTQLEWRETLERMDKELGHIIESITV